MKKVLLLVALLGGGAVFSRRLSPTYTDERLSGLHERMLGLMLDHMPENWP